MSAQAQIERLRSLQEIFNNLVDKTVLMSIDPNTYLPCDESKIDEFIASLPTKEEE